jgi:hypothetical protein
VIGADGCPDRVAASIRDHPYSAKRPACLVACGCCEQGRLATGRRRRLTAVRLFGGRRWRGRISGRAKGVAVASTLFLVARRAAQLTFPCGAFVFFLGTFDPILVLVAIVRKLSRDFVWSAWRSGAFVRFELYDLPNRELVHGALIRLLTVNLYWMDRMRASMSRDLLPVSCREPVDPERSGRKVPLPPMRYWNWPIA